MVASGVGASDGFDVRAWKRLVRNDKFDDAGAYVDSALRDHGVDAVHSLREAYAGLSVDLGWVLLEDLRWAVADDVNAALEEFLWAIYRDPSCPYGHQGLALRMLAARRVAGVKPLLVQELTARSDERRSLALALLAEQGTPDCVDAVLARVRTLLKRPASVGMTHKRDQTEALFGVVAVFRCADRGQLETLARVLRRGATNLAPEERAWLREFWPGCLDQTEDASVPEPNVSRVLDWAAGRVAVEWPKGLLADYALTDVGDHPWQLDPPCVTRT